MRSIGEQRLLNVLRESPTDAPFEQRSLPDPKKTPYRTVKLSIEELKRFRANYAKLILFASYVCDVEPEKLCELDLIGWLYRQAEIPT